jgi:hypothetical protein
MNPVEKGLTSYGFYRQEAQPFEIATGHGTQEKQKADWYIPIGALLIAFD